MDIAYAVGCADKRGETMSRYVDADALKRQIESPYTEYPIMIQIRRLLKEFIDTAPSIGIVRCKECKWWIDNLTENDDDEAYDSCRWDWSRKIPTADDFCSYGEVRDE